VFRLLAVLAEFESDTISERTKNALRHKKAKGEKYSHIVPFGYQEINGRLEIVKSEAKVVANIIQMRKQGAAFGRIAEHLNAEGIQGKRGGKWFASTVRYVLQRQAA
jgi:DNA invertase Pin-like site-specific DNA recombinase